ncbi:fumarylacetoacetase [Pacificispira sp.]|uniref:fumarylacetoacetase n=1 Tax=Pacificispira sp. TaxID=2888761 RepID=UPI003B51F06F
MKPALDETHDPTRKSWVAAANDPGCDFSIQNLPYGVFERDGDARPGIAIGLRVLDLRALARRGLLPVPAEMFEAPSLNRFMAQGPNLWRKTRRLLSDLLDSGNPVLRDDTATRAEALHPIADVRLRLPFDVAEYTDFYASREHATNVGTMFRDPKNALMPNWLHIPIGYNGRASTVVVSGTDIRRPQGQLKSPDREAPTFGPTAKLDIELEIGAVIGTPNVMGTPVTTAEAEAMIFGYVLLNDWSARDIQVWEYQPLGPFQAKVFGTTISPWIVTSDALAPFRVDGPAQDPAPLPYLCQDGPRNIDIALSAALTPAGGPETVISRTNFRHMYWSSAQQLTHHASGGCAMRTGDLLGSGTISGPTRDSCGSLLELTWNGRDPIPLEGGGTRTFIEDGDTLTLRGHAQGDSYRVGFGDCAGTVLPAATKRAHS